MIDMFRGGNNIQGFDYLELIYTVFKMNKNINLQCFIEYDDKIREIIKRYFNENYEVCEYIYKASIIETQEEVCFNEEEKKISDDINNLISPKKETYNFFKPKSCKLPWMFSKQKYDIKNLKLEEWNTQATVGVNYDNIISFMQQIFGYNKTKNKKNIEFDPYRYERFSLDKAIELTKIISPELTGIILPKDIKNWLTLKLFYLTIDRLQFVNLKTYKGGNPPLDGEYVQDNLTKEIDELYKDWIENNIQVKYTYEGEKVKNEIVNKDTYIKTDTKECKDQYTENKDENGVIQKEYHKYEKPGYTDIRTLFNKEYKVNKDTTVFCIRHSLYQVLYELCERNVDTCLNFLSEIIKILEKDKINKQMDVSVNTLNYYIQDFTKGILYFKLLKEKNVRPENDKTFQNYNDPDLSIEKNYGKIEAHTKYRIKYYNFSTKDKEEDGKIILIKNTLLFEIRNYGSLKKAIEIEDDKKRRGQKRTREDEPIEPSVKKQTTIPKKQTTIPKKQTTIPKKTPSTPGVPSWLKPK